MHVYIIAFDQWAMDGTIPDWEGFRAYLRADTSEQAKKHWRSSMGPVVTPAPG